MISPSKVRSELPLSSSSDHRNSRYRWHSAGFTLIELVIVIIILGTIMTLVLLRSGTYQYWKEEGFLRRFSELIVFLHHQAIADQLFYQLEVNFQERSYRVGVRRASAMLGDEFASLGAGAGSLSLELAAFLSPAEASSGEMIPPPSMPSLGTPSQLPADVFFEDIRNMSGLHTPSTTNTATITFSPRGFSEFAVIHLVLSAGGRVTILVNPFTGTTEIFREYKEFEWTYGKQQRNKSR